MNTSELPARLGAIAEPTRFRIVDLLRAGPHSVGDVVAVLALGQPQVSRHLRLLSDAGLVEVRPEGQRRIYSLRRQPFEELNAWFDAVTAIWADRMDQLDAYLHEREP